MTSKESNRLQKKKIILIFREWKRETGSTHSPQIHPPCWCTSAFHKAQNPLAAFLEKKKKKTPFLLPWGKKTNDRTPNEWLNPFFFANNTDWRSSVHRQTCWICNLKVRGSSPVLVKKKKQSKVCNTACEKITKVLQLVFSLLTSCNTFDIPPKVLASCIT